MGFVWVRVPSRVLPGFKSRFEINGFKTTTQVRSLYMLASLDFPGGSEGKASAYNTGDWGSMPGSGRSPGEGNATHSSILAWRIPWMEGA